MFNEKLKYYKKYSKPEGVVEILQERFANTPLNYYSFYSHISFQKLNQNIV